ncbi:cobalt-factor II C(20)-methyltransferase [Escherichia coli]|mgnify:FL=1
MQGKLYAIGTGPGSSDLITVRAARLLGTLDVLYAPAGRRGGDSLALSIVREYLGPQVEVRERHFPMSTHGDEKEQVWDSVAEEMASDVAAGRQVGFVTLGDAMLFSTWVFLLERLQGRVPMEVIPGVTSFAAIAARAVFPLAMEQQSMAVVSCTAPEAELEQALRQHGCIVLMKVYGRFAMVRDLLARLELLPHALLMAEASLPTEQCFRSLGEIGDDVALPYFSTIVVNKAWPSVTSREVV